jgi:hypothetical protein
MAERLPDVRPSAGGDVPARRAAGAAPPRLVELAAAPPSPCVTNLPAPQRARSHGIPARRRRAGRLQSGLRRRPWLTLALVPTPDGTRTSCRPGRGPCRRQHEHASAPRGRVVSDDELEHAALVRLDRLERLVQLSTELRDREGKRPGSVADLAAEAMEASVVGWARLLRLGVRP